MSNIHEKFLKFLENWKKKEQIGKVLKIFFFYLKFPKIIQKMNLPVAYNFCLSYRKYSLRGRLFLFRASRCTVFELNLLNKPFNQICVMSLFRKILKFF